jgi:hypothetical protein
VWRVPRSVVCNFWNLDLLTFCFSFFCAPPSVRAPAMCAAWAPSGCRGSCSPLGWRTSARRARRSSPTAAPWQRRWTPSTSTPRAGPSSPRTAERGARCCAVWRGAAGLPAGAAAAGADADVALPRAAAARRRHAHQRRDRRVRRGAARTSTSNYQPLRYLPIVITEPIQRSRRHLSTRV